MKYLFINIGLLLLFGSSLSCQLNDKQESISPTFDSLEYTSDSWSSANAGFSMKIDKVGKVTSSRGRWEPRNYFQGQLASRDLNDLFKFIKRNDFNSLKPKYVSESLQDSMEMVILITAKDRPVRRFRLYGREVPSQLDSLRTILLEISYSLKVSTINHKIHFASRVGFYPKFSGKLKGWFPEN